MGNILGFNIPINMPSWGIGSGFWYIVILLIVILGLGGVGIYMLYRFKLYNKKIIDFENISGQGFQPVFYDRARTIKIGDGGEELLYLMKRKVYRTAYGRKMGKNVYWFAKGQDGYYYNVLLGDIDAKRGMLDVEPVDRDMRYMHVAIRRNIQDRYHKKSFMDQYGTFIFSGIFLIIMIIGIWFLLDKMGTISTTTADNIKIGREQLQAVKDTAIALNNVADRLSSICGGGSGIIPAT